MSVSKSKVNLGSHLCVFEPVQDSRQTGSDVASGAWLVEIVEAASAPETSL